jgi:hypothetical protein
MVMHSEVLHPTATRPPPRSRGALACRCPPATRRAPHCVTCAAESFAAASEKASLRRRSFGTSGKEALKPPPPVELLLLTRGRGPPLSKDQRSHHAWAPANENRSPTTALDVPGARAHTAKGQ